MPAPAAGLPCTESRSLGRFQSWLLLAAVLLLVLGGKLQQIDRYGSDLPYWDQWDAEGDQLLVPSLEGRLDRETLFQAHNEHRILFTRLMALGLFAANEQRWDARVELIANAVLHALVAVMIAGFATRFLPRWPAVALALLAAVLVGGSVAWENTLAGFQSQFYFVLLFSLLHLAATWLAPRGSLAWWLAPLAGLAALFSMASGVFSSLANIVVAGYVTLAFRRFDRKAVYVFGSSLFLVLMGWMLRVEVAGHSMLKAPSLLAAAQALLLQLSWPIKQPWAAALGLAPSALLLSFVRAKRVPPPGAIFLLAVCAWSGAQLAAIAYARGGVANGFAPRYADLNATAILCGFATLAYLASQARSADLVRHGLRGLCLLFAATVLWGYAIEQRLLHRTVLADLPRINAAREKTVRDYVRTRDPAFYSKAPWDELPYPSASHLARWLDAPILRSILPTSVHPPIELSSPAASTGFIRTDSQQGGSDDVPLDLTFWTSRPPERHLARFRSGPFSVRHSRIGVFVRGNASTPLSIHLRDANGQLHPPLGAPPLLQSHWRRINFAVPSGLYTLEAEVTGSETVAFTQPIIDTWLSQWARKAPRLLWPWLLGAGAILLPAALAAPGRPRSERQVI